MGINLMVWKVGMQQVRLRKNWYKPIGKHCENEIKIKNLKEKEKEGL